MTVINDDQKKRIEAINALDFLRDHPAISPEIMDDSHFDGMWFFMAKCCKRGLSESSKENVLIYRGSKGWEKYKDLFEKKYKDDKFTSKKLQSIEISYEEKFGEPWVFDHVEYWYETTFFVFEGDPYSKTEYMDFKKWGRYAGPMGGANTYEDMLINCADKVKKAFGDFSKFKDFESPEEKRNHEKVKSFHFKPIKSGKHKGCSTMIWHNNYLDVNNGLINLRWLRWFIGTDYCKKNWNFEYKKFQEILKTLDKIPKKRLEILAKYS